MSNEPEEKARVDVVSNILCFILPAFAVGISFGLLKTGISDVAGFLGTSAASTFGSVGIALSFIFVIILRKFQSSENTRTVTVLVSWLLIFVGTVVSALNAHYENEVFAVLLFSIGVPAFDFCLMTASIDSRGLTGGDSLRNFFLNRTANYVGVAIGVLSAGLLGSHSEFAIDSSDAYTLIAFIIIFLIAVASVSSISASMFVRAKNFRKDFSERSGSVVKKAPFMDVVRRLSDEGGLTPRESQVFEYLARGRNVEFISEEFVISKQTTKTHVSKIYKKLKVHSHQELLTLIEERREHGDKTIGF